MTQSNQHFDDSVLNSDFSSDTLSHSNEDSNKLPNTGSDNLSADTPPNSTYIEQNMTNNTLPDIPQTSDVHNAQYNAQEIASQNIAAVNQDMAPTDMANHQDADSEIEFDGDTSRANPHFKPLLPKPIHRGESGRQLIMDTETTGLDALKGDRIIEVGIIELVDRKFTGEKLHVYINPQRGMDDEVIRVHGISEAFLADKPTFDEIAQPLYDFMYGAEIIAHNAPFDITFLSMEFDKVGLKDFAETIKVTDSLVMAKQQYPGQKNTLDALVRRLNVGKMDRTFHGALLDSEILAEVYLAMTGGQVALAIDEDVQSEGESSHADFSELASQILKASSYVREHTAWVASQIKSYPALFDTQNVDYFRKLNKVDNTPPLFKTAPASYALKAINFENKVFIDS